MSNLYKTQRTCKESQKMTLNPDFTLSEDELKIVREAIRKTMAEFLAKQK